MKAALCVNLAGPDVAANVCGIEHLLGEAAHAGAHVAIFPEAAVTGLVNNDDPVHDLPLGAEIPGPITDRLCAAAARHRLYLILGLLEREGASLYDSAVAIDPLGRVVMKYRRIQPQWHAADADPTVYRQGSELPVLLMPWGRMVVLLCGDLFDDGVIGRVRDLRADYLAVPMSRNFGDGSFDQRRWDRQEMGQYAARVAMAECKGLIVNALEDRALTPWPAFGGAWAVDASGAVLAAQRLGEVGMLVVEL